MKSFYFLVIKIIIAFSITCDDPQTFAEREYFSGDFSTKQI